MKKVLESIILNAKDAYKESVIIDNEKLQDLLLTILTDSKKLQELKEDESTTNLNKENEDKVSTRYTYDQVQDITKIQVKLAKEEISYKLAEEEIIKISPTFPIHNIKQYNKRVKNSLKGIGEHGFAFPSNWAKALIEETNNNPLVIQAFKLQQKLYLEKDGKVNKKLEEVLNSIEV